jgi:Winged helix-turn-helix DNA-binding
MARLGEQLLPRRPRGAVQPRQLDDADRARHVLVEIAGNTRARIRDIAVAVGLTERTVQAIIADLEAAGYLTPTRAGRRTVHFDRPFRHPPGTGTASARSWSYWQSAVPLPPGPCPGGHRPQQPGDSPAGWWWRRPAAAPQTAGHGHPPVHLPGTHGT